MEIFYSKISSLIYQTTRRHILQGRNLHINATGSLKFVFISVSFELPFVIFGCRDSSVGIATRYGLDGPGIEPRCGRDFPHTSRPALGPNQPPVQWVPVISWG